MLLLSALLCSKALAAPERPLETLVVTASRYPQPPAAVSASVSVVGREAVANLRHTHINELLQRVPAAWISRGNGQENLTAIRSPVFTGAGSCGSFYMAEDGIPLRPAGFCNVNQLFEANSEQAQRVEVLRGPGTAVHGNNALHGVINVLSRPPARQPETALSLEAGPHDYLRLRASHSERGEEHAWRLSANAAHDGGYRDNAGFDQQKMTLRHDWSGTGLSATTALTAVNLNQETAGYLEGEDAYRDATRRRDNPNPEAFRDNTALRLYSRWQWERPHGEWIVTPFVRYQRMDFLQHFLPGTPLEHNALDNVGWQAMRVWRGADWTLSAGGDGDYTEAYLTQSQSKPVSFSPVFPLGRQYDYTVDALRGAVFVQGDWQLDANDRLNAGLRFAHQRYDYDNHMLPGSTAADGTPCSAGGQPVPCRYSRPADRSDDFDNYTVNLGWIHDVSAQHALVLQLARGFRAPEAAELYRLQAGQLSAELDSERLDSLELGWRWQRPGLQLQLTGFVMRKRDVIYQDDQRRNISGARTRHRGVELALHWQPHPDWEVAAQASWARHQYGDDSFNAAQDIDGNDMDTAPRHMGGAQLTWKPRAGTWAELEWVHMGDYYLDARNRFSYPGHDLLHLRLRQQLNPNVGAGLRLVNATDTEYAERADYAFGEYRYFVGEPRAVYADITLRF